VDPSEIKEIDSYDEDEDEDEDDEGGSSSSSSDEKKDDKKKDDDDGDGDGDDDDGDGEGEGEGEGDDEEEDDDSDDDDSSTHDSQEHLYDDYVKPDEDDKNAYDHMIMQNDMYITNIEGRASKDYIYSLMFQINKKCANGKVKKESSQGQKKTVKDKDSPYMEIYIFWDFTVLPQTKAFIT